jgi:hypothetical protein
MQARMSLYRYSAGYLLLIRRHLLLEQLPLQCANSRLNRPGRRSGGLCFLKRPELLSRGRTSACTELPFAPSLASLPLGSVTLEEEAIGPMAVA